MTVELDSEVLRADIAAAYGVELPGELFRGGTSDAARVMLADRLAGAISSAAPRSPVPRAPCDALADWTPLPSAPDTPGDPAAATARLLAWARAGDADLAALDIRTSPAGYRTAHARRDLAAGERVLYVPRTLLFDLAHARCTPVGQTIAARGIRLSSEHTLLAAALIAERHDPTSRWRPYLDALPHGFPTLPVFQDAAALAPTRARYPRRSDRQAALGSPARRVVGRTRQRTLRRRHRLRTVACAPRRRDRARVDDCPRPQLPPAARHALDQRAQRSCRVGNPGHGRNRPPGNAPPGP